MLLRRYRNGTHQILAYAEDIILICDNIRKTERNTDVLLNACKDIGLAVNTGKTKYMKEEHHQGQEVKMCIPYVIIHMKK